ADTVEHDVHATAVGQLLDALAELGRGRVVDDVVGAEGPGLVELPVAAGRGDHARTDALGDGEAEAPHPAADGLDEHVLPGFELHALDEAMPCGVTGERERRGLVESHAVGNALQVGRGDLAVLRVAAVELAAEPLLSLAVFVPAEHTRRAGAALHAV